MQLTENFNQDEFACHCGCGYKSISVDLVKMLQQLRDDFEAPVHVVSGCRCEAHNRKVGGADKSYHVKGLAVDIKVKGVDPTMVYHYLEKKYPNKYGLGLYPTWVHFDIRPIGIWRGKK